MTMFGSAFEMHGDIFDTKKYIYLKPNLNTTCACNLKIIEVILL